MNPSYQKIATRFQRIHLSFGAIQWACINTVQRRWTIQDGGLYAPEIILKHAKIGGQHSI